MQLDASNTVMHVIGLGTWRLKMSQHLRSLSPSITDNCEIFELFVIIMLDKHVKQLVKSWFFPPPASLIKLLTSNDSSNQSQVSLHPFIYCKCRQFAVWFCLLSPSSFSLIVFKDSSWCYVHILEQKSRFWLVSSFLAVPGCLVSTHSPRLKQWSVNSQIASQNSV